MYYNWKDVTNIDELKIVCNLIKNGELVIFPTETVYGIGANALDKDAVSKIFVAKGRPTGNPLIVHLADKRDIEKYVKEVTPVEQKLIDAFMPGPFTLILPKKDIIPDVVSAGLDTVAIRMPNNVIARGIISHAGVPIAAPSANISGRPSGTRLEDIRKELEGKVSAIIDGGETEIGLESTVVKVIHEIPVILRPGKITDKDIIDVVGIAKYDNKIFEQINEDQIVESPGMKYKHYAPNTKCLLVAGDDPLDRVFYINRFVRQYRGDVAVISFDEHIEKIDAKGRRFISMGSRDNLEEVARNMYSALRKADEVNAEIILIEGVKKEGIGIAIMNRLLRAAGYNVFEK